MLDRLAAPTTARHHTGPRTAQGKAASSRNACTHGLLSPDPVATPYEQPEAWHAYRDAIVHDLAPYGDLETILAERIALLHWRQARIARHECALITQDQVRLSREQAERRFAVCEDRPSTMAELDAERRSCNDRLALLERWAVLEPEDVLTVAAVHSLLEAMLAPLGPQEATVPLLLDATATESLEHYCGRQRWTRLLVEAALEPICGVGTSVATMHAVAVRRAGEAVSALARARSDQEIGVVAATHGLAELRVLERLARYEAHLSREMQRTRRELAEVRAERRAAEHSGNCETNSRPEGTAAPAGAAVIRAAEHQENCETNSPLVGPAAPALPRRRRTAVGTSAGPSPASRPDSAAQSSAAPPPAAAGPCPAMLPQLQATVPAPASSQPRPTAMGSPTGPCPAVLP